MDYFLLDLERTLLSGVPSYWRSNRRGYTYNIHEAGIYKEAEASRIAEADFNKRTLLVSCKTAEDILSIKVK